MINGTEWNDKEKISLLKQELIDRMQVGKVYSPEEVKKAYEQYDNREITSEELNEIILNSSIDRNGENLSNNVIKLKVLQQAQYRDRKVLESTRQAYSFELEPQDLSKAKDTIKDELINEQELITEDEKE